MNDAELLRRYVEDGSEEAFRQVVGRHARWVYCASVRQLRDGTMAEDVTQAVFMTLARKARGIGGRGMLSGWLFKVMGYACADARKREQRRKRHEAKAAAMIKTTCERPEDEWGELSGRLEEMVGKLGRRDREAILLRYYEQKSLGEVGEVLGVSEEAAKKCVYRAVERLRELFGGGGMALSAKGLGAVMAAKMVGAGPEGLAGVVADAALGGQVVGVGVSGIVKGINMMMVWARVKVAAAVCAVLGMLAGMGAVAVQRGAGQTQAAAAIGTTSVAQSPATAPATMLPAVPPLVNEIDELILANRRAIARGHFRIILKHLGRGAELPMEEHTIWFDYPRVREDIKINGLVDTFCFSDKWYFKWEGPHRGKSSLVTVAIKDVDPREHYIYEPLKAMLNPSAFLGAKLYNIDAVVGSPDRTNIVVEKTKWQEMDAFKVSFTATKLRGNRISYWVLPTRGYNITRMEMHWRDAANVWAMTSVQCSLQHVRDEIWFPKLLQWRTTASSDGQDIEFDVQSVNEPLDTQRFSPITMNVPPGTSVSFVPAVPNGRHWWNGSEIVPMSEAENANMAR